MRPFLILALALVAACGSIEQQATVSKPPSLGKPYMAGVGDAVLDMRLTESLPNAFGKADAFGRTRDAGRVIVRYVGQRDQQALFARQDLTLQSNDTTMSRTPLLLPNIQQTNASGNIGSVPISGSATTIGTGAYIPGSPASSFPVQSSGLQLAAPVGGSVLVEGRRIKVLRLVDGGIEYSVN